MPGRRRANPHPIIDVTAPSEFDKEGGDEPAPDVWKELGLPPHSFLDDRLAPRVDREFLRRLVRGELPEPAASTASRLILLFPSWSRAHQEVVAQQGEGP